VILMSRTKKGKGLVGYSFYARKRYHRIHRSFKTGRGLKSSFHTVSCGGTFLDVTGTEDQIRKKKPKLTACPSCFKDGGS
jgi:hypothetical protein